jgi:adenylate cyclase
MLPRLRETSNAASAGPALAAVALILAMTRWGLLEHLDLLLYDVLLTYRPVTTAPSRVTLVSITETDIKHALGSWPISDDRLADVLDRILAFKPRAIGVDIYRDQPVPPASQRLPSLLRAHPEIVMPRKFPEPGSVGVSAPSYLADDQVGCSDVVIDPDGHVRRGLLYLGDDTSSCRSLALRVALRYLERDGIGETAAAPESTTLKLGRSELRPFEANDGGYVDADAGGYQILLDFRDVLAGATRYDLERLIDGPVELRDFADRAVLIGVDAESVKDHFTLLPGNTERFQPGVAGVALHGTVVSQLLRAALDGEGPLVAVADYTEVLWLALWITLGTCVCYRARRVKWLLTEFVSGALIQVATGYALIVGNIWLPLAPALAGWWMAIAINTALVSRREHLQRRLLKQLFALHVDSQIAEEIWAHREVLCRGGRIPPRKLVATIFFSDLQGFTRVAETLEPEAFIAWLNEYLDAMTAIIQRHGGVVIRFVGDAILAGFGVPVARDTEEAIARDALNACRCALEIGRVLIEMNRDWVRRGLPTAAMRIGINTGPMLAGSLGNKDRLEYTVHGDVVNTAARLETFDKDGFQPDPLANPCRTLIGLATQVHVAESVHLRFLGSVVVKGKASVVRAYELLGETSRQGSR